MTTASVAGPHRQDSSLAWWVCFVMCLTFTFSYMDRSVLPLLIAPLERSLGLTDTTVSLLQGAAFAVFYASFGFPLARMSDNGNRRNLIIIGVIVWCLATIGCGFARTIPQLFAGRIFVAIGEAVLQPAAVSILADYFSPRLRTKALSVYSTGVFFGGGLALGLGGTLLRHLGSQGADLGSFGHFDSWRIVFIAMGAVSLVILPLLLTVREPVRLSDAGVRSTRNASLAEVRAEFSRKRAALLATILGFATTGMATSTVGVWAPTLFVRVHHWQLGQAGQRIGLGTLVLSPLGAICGALLADRLTRAGRSDAKLIVGVISASICAVASFVITMPSATVAFAALVTLQFVAGFNFGLVQAALAELMPNRMRGLAAAGYIAASNLLSAALGPLVVGVLNDHVFHNPIMIATSIRIVAPASFLAAAAILFRGLRPFRTALLLPPWIEPADNRDRVVLR